MTLMTYTDTTRITKGSVEYSSYYEDNRLDNKDYSFDVYAYIYDASNLLEPTEPNIRNGGLSVYRWSVQPCNGMDVVEIERQVNEALVSLVSPYSVDLKPRAQVFGPHGEILFSAPWQPAFTRECRSEDINPDLNPNLEGRVVRMSFYLESSSGGTVTAVPRVVTILPPDYAYCPPDLLPEPDEKVSDDDW